jgi:amino acid transporter
MAFIYAELASAHPVAGGENALFGRTLGPMAGFVYMGMYAIGGSLAPAVLALGAGAAPATTPQINEGDLRRRAARWRPSAS